MQESRADISGETLFVLDFTFWVVWFDSINFPLLDSRCNELMVLGKYLEVLEEYLNVLAKVLACTCKVHGSRYGRIGRRIKPCVQITGTWTVEMSAMSVHGPSM